MLTGIIYIEHGTTFMICGRGQQLCKSLPHVHACLILIYFFGPLTYILYYYYYKHNSVYELAKYMHFAHIILMGLGSSKSMQLLYS